MSICCVNACLIYFLFGLTPIDSETWVFLEHSTNREQSDDIFKLTQTTPGILNYMLNLRRDISIRAIEIQQEFWAVDISSIL